jgi:dihydropteroate synthase
MGILNVTPDSFSDGGKYASADAAIRRAEAMAAEGVDIIDIGGESTRPGARRMTADIEVSRVVPVIEAIARRFDIPISIDTTRSEVALRAVDAGAEIINDISALRFDPAMAVVTVQTGAALVLMHSRGDFETMHSQPPVDDIFDDVVQVLRNALSYADRAGVDPLKIAIDVGIGFGKTMDQNLELIAKVGKLADEFHGHAIVAGTSRKSFIGKLLGGVSADERLNGSLATAVIAAWNGANIVRAHDVRATVDALRITAALASARDHKL